MDCRVHGVTKSQTWLSGFHTFTKHIAFIRLTHRSILINSGQNFLVEKKTNTYLKASDQKLTKIGEDSTTERNTMGKIQIQTAFPMRHSLLCEMHRKESSSRKLQSYRLERQECGAAEVTGKWGRNPAKDKSTKGSPKSMYVLAPQSCLTLCSPWTIARQAPRCMEFSRQEYMSG